MKKIPTIFERDWDGSRVLPKINSACQWVFDGEGKATVKWDGTSVMIRDGKMYKRREIRDSDLANLSPAAFSFEIVDHDEVSKKAIGWVPVGDGPEDRWHREAWDYELSCQPDLPDGTYELIGPKIQGNPEHARRHELWRHGSAVLEVPPELTYDGIKWYFAMRGCDIEGIVWHHPDGRMAKIKLRDFGLKRKYQFLWYDTAERK